MGKKIDSFFNGLLLFFTAISMFLMIFSTGDFVDALKTERTNIGYDFSGIGVALLCPIIFLLQMYCFLYALSRKNHYRKTDFTVMISVHSILMLAALTEWVVLMYS